MTNFMYQYEGVWECFLNLLIDFSQNPRDFSQPTCIRLGLVFSIAFFQTSDEAEAEMEEEEERLLKSLGWQGKGLIQSASTAEADEIPLPKTPDGRKKAGSLRFYKPKFKYIFCDMDGTLLNSKSRISATNANALREASSRGIKVVITTGKTCPAAIAPLKMVDLAGRDGISSEYSPGVFIQ